MLREACDLASKNVDEATKLENKGLIAQLVRLPVPLASAGSSAVGASERGWELLTGVGWARTLRVHIPWDVCASRMHTPWDVCFPGCTPRVHPRGAPSRQRPLRGALQHELCSS